MKFLDETYQASRAVLGNWTIRGRFWTILDRFWTLFPMSKTMSKTCKFNWTYENPNTAIRVASSVVTLDEIREPSVYMSMDCCEFALRVMSESLFKSSLRAELSANADLIN